MSTVALFTAGCGPKPAADTATPSPATKGSPAAKKTTKLTENEVNPVPADWITMSDDVKGYEFQVPKGTEHATDTTSGVDVYTANVPAPYDINVLVFAFKDKTATKEDLMKRVEAALTAMGEKDIKVGAAAELTADYSIATISSVGKDAKTTKGKVLVATDG